jgi:hypothetical protein
MHTIEEAIGRVDTRRFAPSFTPERYPHTYGCDFVRTHWDIVPDEVALEIYDTSGVPSRSAASRAIKMWAEALGVDEQEAYEKFADAYLREHGITRPKNRKGESR